MNQEFERLKSQYLAARKQQEVAISSMRNNLLTRNDGADEYVFGYTREGKVLHISSCKVEDLFEINGDMIPLRK